MKRANPPKRDVEKAREWEQRSRDRAIERAKKKRRKPLPRKSAKQTEIDRERATIKAEKLAAAGVHGTVRPSDVTRACLGVIVWPEIFCGIVSAERPLIELHEVVQRSLWRAGAVHAGNCVLLCQAHHEAVDE